MIKVILILLLTLCADTSPNITHIMEVLKQVESRGNTKAIGDSGRAYGILQIHNICVKDVNRLYGTNYSHSDAFDEVCSEEIFTLYLSKGIEFYKKKHGKHPTEKDIVRMWNGGIYSGYRKNSTLGYYKKYLKFKDYVYWQTF